MSNAWTESIFGNRPFAYVYTVVLVWMMCHAHKTSSLISMKSYYDSSLISSWYDLQSALAYGWVLFMGSGSHELVVDSAFYWIVACGAAFVFAELGEVSSLKRIVLRPGFYWEMDPTALTVFWLWIIFTLGTIGASVWRARGRISTLVAPIIATFLYYLLGFAVLYFPLRDKPRSIFTTPSRPACSPSGTDRKSEFDGRSGNNSSTAFASESSFRDSCFTAAPSFSRWKATEKTPLGTRGHGVRWEPWDPCSPGPWEVYAAHVDTGTSPVQKDVASSEVSVLIS